MGKVSQKEVEVLMREADRAVNHDAFRYLRKLQPNIVKQIADIAGDAEISAVSSRAMGKKLVSKEGEAFAQSCTPARIASMCKKALSTMLATRAEPATQE